MVEPTKEVEAETAVHGRDRPEKAQASLHLGGAELQHTEGDQIQDVLPQQEEEEEDDSFVIEEEKSLQLGQDGPQQRIENVR